MTNFESIVLLQVGSIHSLWQYITATFLPYSISGLRGYQLDGANFLVTNPEIRQLRVKPDAGLGKSFVNYEIFLCQAYISRNLSWKGI